MREFDPVRALTALSEGGVRFVLIGGIAARLRGAPVLTEDIDITPDRSQSNLEALAAVLVGLNAKLRTPNDPDGVAFPMDATMLKVNASWTLVTDAGDLDLVFEPAGTKGYEDLIRSAEGMAITADRSVIIPVAALIDIIRSKEAAGRDKDRAALPLLRRTLEESQG